MKFVVDTSALLTLSCSSHFSLILKEHNLIITPLVLEELQTASKYSDLLGTHAKKLLLQKFIIKQVRGTQYSDAEQEVFALAKKENLVALTDDIRAAKHASKQNIKTRPSFYVLLLLFKKKHITKQDLIKEFQLILTQRNWLNGALWEYAYDLIQKV